MGNPKWKSWVCGLLFILLTYVFASQFSQGDVYGIVGVFSIWMVLYLWFNKKASTQDWLIPGLSIAIFLRLFLIVFEPNLSDDYFRFIWDGRLSLQGVNPFAYLPFDLIQMGNEAGVNVDVKLYAQLNSPKYYTVYPIVNQSIFAFSVWLFPEGILGPMYIMKSFFFLGEIGTIWCTLQLLDHFNKPKSLVLLYALNPLIVLESYHNLHFEILMIFFLVLGFYFLVFKNWIWAVLPLSLAVATKIIPLMFFPFLIKRMSWKTLISFSLCGFIILVLLFSPIFFNAHGSNLGSSLDLYFQRFEFNASIYYFLRFIGFQIAGHNLIAVLGPLLGLIAGILILLLAWKHKTIDWKSLPSLWMFAMTIYLIFATTIHPWYLSIIIWAMLFTPFRFPILWSWLIMFTYVNYSFVNYHEMIEIMLIEYILLFSYLYWEWKKHNFKKELV